VTQSRRRTPSAGGLRGQVETFPHVLARRGPPAWSSSLIAGALPALAFPEPGLWPLAYVGLVPLLLLIRAADERRDAMVRAWLGGTAFLLATHHWLAPKAGMFLLVAVVALGTLWAPWGGAVHSLLTGTPTAARALAAVAVLPAGWVLIEAIRSWESLGGPFGLLGASVWNVRPLLALAALGGVWILSFVAVAVNVAIALSLSARRDVRVAAVALGVGALALASGPIYDALRPRPPATRAARVAVVQVGLTDGPDERFASGVASTRGLAGEDLDLIVWGESSVGFDLNDRPDLLDGLRELSSALDTPLLVNIDARRGGNEGIYKSSVLIGPQGAADTYDKMRLVPFGEYIPLRSVLGWLSSITDAAVEDRRRGRDLEVMEAGGIEFAPLICFESAFPDMARAVTAMGSGIIVYQSAITTFQDSWAPETHAGLAAVRAVETGRPVVHATLTGVTTAFDGLGRKLLWVGSDETGAYVVRLPLTGGTTAFVRYGDWVPVASLAIVIIAAATVAGTQRSRQRSLEGGPIPETNR
jgi:apolipoprotein N-acyltransferase